MSQPLSQQELIAYVYSRAPSYNLDPNAVLAVAQQEGLGGGIGDGGLAYGPWQDHLTEFSGRPFYGKGANNADVQAWAWSSEGVDYVLGQMSQVAAGKQGQDAISSIVHGFERPANPGTEIASAWAAFTSWASGVAQQLPSMQGNPAANQPIGSLLPGPGGTTTIAPGQSAIQAAGGATQGALQGVTGGLQKAQQAAGQILSTLSRPGFWWAVLLFGGALAAIVAGAMIYFKGDLSVRRLTA